MDIFAPLQTTLGSYFVVKNITNNNIKGPKIVRIFNYPITENSTRDLLKIPGVSSSDIKSSIIKGEIRNKIISNEIKIQSSNIDLLSFNTQEIAFLYASGIVTGVEIIGGGGLTSTTHYLLRQLIHLADGGPYEGFSGAYKETLPIDPFPTSIIWWFDSSKTGKIVEKNIIYNINKTPSSIIYKVYDTDGETLLTTATDTITYSSVFESSRIRVIT